MGKMTTGRKLAILSDSKKREEEKRRREREMRDNDYMDYEDDYDPYMEDMELYHMDIQKAARGSRGRSGRGNSGSGYGSYSGGRGRARGRARDSRGRFKSYMPDMRNMYPNDYDMDNRNMEYWNNMNNFPDMTGTNSPMYQMRNKHYNMQHDRNYMEYPEMQDYPITAGGVFWMDNKKDEEMQKLFEKIEHFDRRTAEKWVSHMDNPEKEGSKGGKWTFEQVSGMAQQRKLNVDPVVLFATLNMVWSDYYDTAKKYNVANTDFFLDLAMDWIEDDDVKAGREKTPMYYHLVVENCLEKYK